MCNNNISIVLQVCMQRVCVCPHIDIYSSVCGKLLMSSNCWLWQGKVLLSYLDVFYHSSLSVGVSCYCPVFNDSLWEQHWSLDYAYGHNCSNKNDSTLHFIITTTCFWVFPLGVSTVKHVTAHWSSFWHKPSCFFILALVLYCRLTKIW